MSRNGRHISISASNRRPRGKGAVANRSRYDIVIISLTEQACARFSTGSIANKGGKSDRPIAREKDGDTGFK